MKNLWAWVDLETTGLDNTDLILEIAIVITTPDLIPQNSFQAIVNYPPDVPGLLQMSSFVRDMHTKSGLLEDMEKVQVRNSLEDVNRKAIEWMIEQFQGDKPPLCGCSPHFDRRFLKEYMPGLESRFHYRNIDVSTLRRVTRDWVSDYPEYKKKDRHRSFPDCIDAIWEAKHYKKIYEEFEFGGMP